MVALLVLATFVVFVGVDFLLHREKYKFRVADASHAEAPHAPAPVVAGVALPDGLHYHPGHAWAQDQGNGRMRIGLDEFAASLLGTIDRIDAPQRGRWVRQGEKGWSVMTQHGEAVMLAPAEGEIVAVNDKAIADPESVSRDPYGNWLLEVYSPDAQVSVRNLLSGTVARRWMEETVAEFRQFLSPAVSATALDGGRIAEKVGAAMAPETWQKATKQFFRS